ncbi:MAG: hypothetical protein WCF57_06755 [Pyrinomonadaceae bacterium]
MTPEEHNKTLGILHLVYGGLQSLIMLTMMVFFSFFAEAMRRAPGGGNSEAGLFLGIMMVVLLFSLAFTIPSFVAGYGLLKRKSWAKLWGIIAGVVAGMSFPLGTALCVYSIWFLIGDAGKALYGDSNSQPKRRETLYGAPEPAGWAAQYASREHEHDYAHPPQPPNWRD